LLPYKSQNNSTHPTERHAKKHNAAYTLHRPANHQRPTTNYGWLLRSSPFGLQLVTGPSLPSRQPRCQNTEWRAGNIVEFHFVAELDRRRLSAVLTADPNFQVRASLAAAFGGDLHQLSDTF